MPCDSIYDTKLESRILEQQIAMLGVNVKQTKANLTKRRYIYRAIIDEGTTLSVRRDFTTKDTFRWFIIDFVLLEDTLQVVTIYVENAFYGTFGRSRHDATSISSSSCKQT